MIRAALRDESLRARHALAVVAGLISALGQAPVSFWPAGLAGLVLALQLHLTARSPRRAAGLGWSFGAAYFAATLFWIVEPFFVDAARHGWMSPFALAAMAGGMALFWGGATWIAARWMPGRLGWVAAMAGVEVLRTYIFGGFPWSLIGYVWIGWAPAQLAAVIGPHGLTILTLALVALINAALPRHRKLTLAAWALLAVMFGFGREALNVAPLPNTGTVVRLVQPNAPQALKFDPEWGPRFLDRMIDFTAAGEVPDLVLWPETSVPYRLDDAGPVIDEITEAARGAPVGFGIVRTEGWRGYNTLAILDGQGGLTATYDKHHLVPFGEYIPAPWLLSRIGLSTFTQSEGYGFSAGPGPQLLDLGPLGRALPLICYEAAFPQDLRGTDRPDWLLQITNDAWFGSLSGPYQHLAQSRLRAIEQGLPMVRVANTGISALIDARGRVVAQIPLNTDGWLDVTLPRPLSPTVYSRTGDMPAYLMILGLFGYALVRMRRKTD